MKKHDNVFIGSTLNFCDMSAKGPIPPKTETFLFDIVGCHFEKHTHTHTLAASRKLQPL